MFMMAATDGLLYPLKHGASGNYLFEAHITSRGLSGDRGGLGCDGVELENCMAVCWSHQWAIAALTGYDTTIS